jgi:hypothetical protein
MEAHLVRAAVCAATLLSLGASYRTQNFIVTAPTSHFAQQVAMSAENYRRDLAVEWLGRELPPWSQPCPIRVDVGPTKGAGGATSFAFHGGRPMDWTMSIQGSADRILDSVLPHEITHTVFATHFGRPLPRWADEGACTTVEHESERQKQHRMLYDFLTTGRGIAFNRMFAMTDYPEDVLPLYAQGYSLARFMIAQGGKRKFIDYVGDGMKWNNWTKATQEHYSYQSLSDLQVNWLEWVRRGCPEMATPGGTQLAGVSHPPSPDSTPAQLVSTGAGPAASHGPAEAVAAVPMSAEPTSSFPAAGQPRAPTGWYARVRDETAVSRSREASRTPAASALHDAVGQALSQGADVPAAQVVTRPPAFERAQQRVIQWR